MLTSSWICRNKVTISPITAYRPTATDHRYQTMPRPWRPTGRPGTTRRTTATGRRAWSTLAGRWRDSSATHLRSDPPTCPCGPVCKTLGRHTEQSWVSPVQQQAAYELASHQRQLHFWQSTWHWTHNPDIKQKLICNRIVVKFATHNWNQISNRNKRCVW